MAFNQFSTLMQNWDSWGLFSHILPFLLIFAVVFGILSRMGMFRENKGIQAIISIVLGLLAIRTNLLGDVLKVISPRLGVGLVVLFALLILIGLFIPDESQGMWGWILMGAGLVIFIVIIGQTADVLKWFNGGYYGDDLVSYIVLIVLLIGVIVAVVASGSDKSKKEYKKLGQLFDKITE